MVIYFTAVEFMFLFFMCVGVGVLWREGRNHLRPVGRFSEAGLHE